MPIFEYRCLDCRKKFEKIVLSAAGKESPSCPHCGGRNGERLVSRFATASKGEEGDFSSDFGDDFGADEGMGDDDTGEASWGGPPSDDDDDDAGGGEENGEDDD